MRMFKKSTLLIMSTVIGCAAAMAHPQSQLNNSIVIHSENLKWQTAPAGLPAGAQIAILEGDPTAKGPFTIRLKMPAGYKVAPHMHPSLERVTWISGRTEFGFGKEFFQQNVRSMKEGDFILVPAGVVHYANILSDTIIQISGNGPFEIHYVDSRDDPRQATSIQE